MSTAQKLTGIIREFKARHGLEGSEHHLAAAIHIMNSHKVDKDTATDQTSLEPNDHGIDAWFLSADQQKLYIYQSKFSESIAYSGEGIGDIRRAHEWLTTLICDGKRAEALSNSALRNLTSAIAPIAENIREIEYVLLCLCSEQIEDQKEWKGLFRHLESGRLNKFLNTKNGGIELNVCRHNFSRAIARTHKRYRVETFSQTQIGLRNGVYLRLAYIPLTSLIRLYRERGSNLFEKNVRMSLMSFKDANNRVAHPMDVTLREIVEGRLAPELFPFYHLGVTLWAASEDKAVGDCLNLESPAVVNGCQTINIADRFFRTLEDESVPEEHRVRFSQIRVVAKIVIGSSDDELREITNSNNRQNPIEEWQLFSNNEIHHQIEAALKDQGIFYERQKGRLKTIAKETEVLQEYPNTNDAAITIPDLAGIIALCRGEMKWAAKFSEIFSDRKNHDSIFSESIIGDLKHAVLLSNLSKAARRALSKLFREDERAVRNRHLLDKPSTRVHFWRLALLFGYQKMDDELKEKFSKKLNRTAPPTLVEEIGEWYTSILSKVLPIYRQAEREGKEELSSTAKARLFKEIAVAKKLQPTDLPFRR